jgi:signal transduction histidine kinase
MRVLLIILRKFFRSVARSGRESDAWPVLLLLFAVLVPAVCLLWFMSAAMRNERFASRERLADVYRSQLSSVQMRFNRYWQETAAELDRLASQSSPAVAFARAVQSGRVDSVLIFDANGKILYPNTASQFNAPSELENQWREANGLEYLRHDFIAAARHYEALAAQVTNLNVIALARQAQARCLLQAEQTNAAIQLVTDVLSGERFDRAADAQGRHIAANAELMVLEFLQDNRSPAFQETAQRLARRLNDYENPTLASPQRRFLMEELRRLSPQIQLPTLEAEKLAAAFRESDNASNSSVRFHRVPALQASRFVSPSRRVAGLVRDETLKAALKSVTASDALPAGAEITLLAPDGDSAAAFVTLPAGEWLPGWRMALFFKNSHFFDTTTKHQTAIYFWTCLLVIAAMGVLALLAIRLLRGQLALARLKNDLAATVSHELKTPLSSMRVLVDTLLDSDHIEEQKAREYLQLIARENERLSRVIQNFLTFSRLERNKHTFDLNAVSLREVIDSVVIATQERLSVPGCQFEVHVDENLPCVRADADALATVLINLLDNACKYSGEDKHIVLRAGTENGNAIVSVADNGIGIPARDLRRIFQPFQQLDQRVAREGSGCGLGLSIVQRIVDAHHGHVSVRSVPGEGSTFVVSIPCVPNGAHMMKEAAA